MITIAVSIDRSEQHARRLALLVTAVAATILLLVLLFVKLITPIPAIPADAELISVEIGLPGNSGGSSGNTEAAGSAATASTEDASTDAENAQASEQPANTLLQTIKNWNRNKGSASIKVGGTGIVPYTTGIGVVPGPDAPDSTTHGGGGSRSIVSKPEIVNPTQEEGKVAVNVYVDRTGTVKKAEVNIAGTTTMNSVLRATAAQSAYKIKFNADPIGPELVMFPVDINFTLK